MSCLALQINPTAGTGQEANQAVQTLAEVAAGTHQLTANPGVATNAPGGAVSVELGDGTHAGMATLAEATINNEGQLILTGDASALGGGSSCW